MFPISCRITSKLLTRAHNCPLHVPPGSQFHLPSLSLRPHEFAHAPSPPESLPAAFAPGMLHLLLPVLKHASRGCPPDWLLPPASFLLKISPLTHPSQNFTNAPPPRRLNPAFFSLSAFITSWHLQYLFVSLPHFLDRTISSREQGLRFVRDGTSSTEDSGCRTARGGKPLWRWTEDVLRAERSWVRCADRHV